MRKYPYKLIRIIHRAVSLKMKPSGKTLVFCLNKIGDTVFTIPAIREILKTDSNVTLVCFEYMKPVLEDIFPECGFLYIREKDFAIGSRFARPYLLKIIRNINPEKIYDLTGNPRSIFLSSLTSAKTVYGLDYYNYLFNFLPVRKRRPVHLTKTFLDVADGNDNSSEDGSFPNIKYNFEAPLLIHPFAGWEAKEWGIDKFIELAERLNLKRKTVILFPPESLPEDIKARLKKKQISYKITSSIKQLVEEIKKGSLFIGCDSGPLYIAALYGKPTFSIYGPTNPDFSAPSGKNHYVINKKLRCSPGEGWQYCFTFAGRKGCPSYECMNRLEVDEVYKAVNQALYDLEANAGVNKVE